MKRAFAVIFVVIACLGIGTGTYFWESRRQRSAVYEELKETAIVTPSPSPSSGPAPTPSPRPEETPAPTPMPTPEPYVSPVDFDSLWAIDPDVFAWIEIPDTNISYPIAKHPTDDIYYLDHTIEGYSGYPGAIFTFSYTAADFSQFNTIIYGHNMASGRMFANLNKYRDRSYMDGHRMVYIYTPEAEFVYKVFAFVYYDDRLIDTYYNQRDMEDRQAFLDSLYDLGSSRTYVLDDVDVDANSRIITLSTCHGVSSERTLVLAVRVDEE